MHIFKPGISRQRWIAFIVAGGAGAAFAAVDGIQRLMFIIAALGLFLGITDFGRQCPLVLSLQHIVARIRKKK